MTSPEKTVLVVIDVQGRLAQLMVDKDRLFGNLKKLVQAAQLFEIPIICTEQVPEKIGGTVPEVSELIETFQPVPKESFSCYQEEEFVRTLKDLGRKHILIAGIEAHVCVYQTVSDLLEAGFQVELAADAVSSRSASNLEISIDRMKDLGAQITSVEMAVCEWARGSTHPKFKEMLNLIK